MKSQFREILEVISMDINTDVSCEYGLQILDEDAESKTVFARPLFATDYFIPTNMMFNISNLAVIENYCPEKQGVGLNRIYEDDHIKVTCTMPCRHKESGEGLAVVLDEGIYLGLEMVNEEATVEEIKESLLNILNKVTADYHIELPLDGLPVVNWDKIRDDNYEGEAVTGLSAKSIVFQFPFMRVENTDIVLVRSIIYSNRVKLRNLNLETKLDINSSLEHASELMLAQLAVTPILDLQCRLIAESENDYAFILEQYIQPNLTPDGYRISICRAAAVVIETMSTYIDSLMNSNFTTRDEQIFKDISKARSEFRATLNTLALEEPIAATYS